MSGKPMTRDFLKGAQQKNKAMLCESFKSGLPAEIEARHKQYEYYRDKLLTFSEK